MTLAIRSDRAPLSARQMRLSHFCWRSKLSQLLLLTCWIALRVCSDCWSNARAAQPGTLALAVPN